MIIGVEETAEDTEVEEALTVLLDQAEAEVTEDTEKEEAEEVQDTGEDLIAEAEAEVKKEKEKFLSILRKSLVIDPEVVGKVGVRVREKRVRKK